MVTLPRPSDAVAARIALDIDPEETSRFVLALMPPDKPEGDIWSDHLIWLGLQETDSGPTELALAIQKTVQARMAAS